MNTIEIHSYKKSYQKKIDLMISEIETEFLLPISNGNSSSEIILDRNWIALHKNELVGTIGIFNIDDSSSVLKNMFVKKAFRGKNFNTAQLLLNKLINWAIDAGQSNIYLGTMSQFKAAHKFYEKNDFIKINKIQLPNNFICNPIDDVFYKKQLLSNHEEEIFN